MSPPSDLATVLSSRPSLPRLVGDTLSSGAKLQQIPEEREGRITFSPKNQALEPQTPNASSSRTLGW